MYELVVAFDDTLRLSGLLSREPEARGSALHYVEVARKSAYWVERGPVSCLNQHRSFWFHIVPVYQLSYLNV